MVDLCINIIHLITEIPDTLKFVVKYKKKIHSLYIQMLFWYLNTCVIEGIEYLF